MENVAESDTRATRGRRFLVSSESPVLHPSCKQIDAPVSLLRAAFNHLPHRFFSPLFLAIEFSNRCDERFRNDVFSFFFETKVQRYICMYIYIYKVNEKRGREKEYRTREYYYENLIKTDFNRVEK